tara:strand:- start:1310 stop:1762 length:453 start_codon:yes stop_codon:yes gene_type:complete
LKAYPDTSFLCALYRNQDNSAHALEYRAQMNGPLVVTRLLLWEFRQSVRFQAFRHGKDPSVGFPVHEAERMIAKVGEHCQSGDLLITDCDFLNVLIVGEQLSKSRTYQGGHRSFDILHIATAVELGAREFLTFDVNQRRLAEAEGLAVPL